MIHQDMLAKWLTEPEFKQAYDALENDFSLLTEMITARTARGLTLDQVAKKMYSTAPVVARLERLSTDKQVLPTLNLLREYAHAMGYRLQNRFINNHTTPINHRDLPVKKACL